MYSIGSHLCENEVVYASYKHNQGLKNDANPTRQTTKFLSDLKSLATVIKLTFSQILEELSTPIS
jgi:hypothetical protein